MNKTVLAMTALLAACSGPQDPATEDLTAEEHEAEAEREEAEAAENERLAARSGSMYSLDAYDPSDSRLAIAAEHRDHAEAHRRQAEALRAFENEECGEFPDSARSACPFLLGLREIEDVDGGARVVFDVDAPIDAILDHIRCHLAFVAAQGSEGIDDCALYVPGATVQKQGNSIVLTTDQADHVAELRRRVRVQETH
jgi:hypothetical protein